MKVRKGFVTNSSSSSFIIEESNEVTIDSLKEAISLLLKAEKIHFKETNEIEEAIEEPVIITEEMIQEEKKEIEDNYSLEDIDHYNLRELHDEDAGKILIREAYDNSLPGFIKEYLRFELPSRPRHYMNG